jgi:sugar lactone lactonase YvrE
MTDLDFQLIGGSVRRAQLGESPVWNPETGDIWWVDIDGSALLRWQAGTELVHRWSTPEVPGFVVLTDEGLPAVGMQTGIFLFDPDLVEFERIVPFENPGERFNDAAVDRRGRLWVSTMAMDVREGAARVFLVTEALELKPVVSGLTIPNGLAVDLERDRLYFSDSHPDIQMIWTLDLKDDLPKTGRPNAFATTRTLKGRPDGAALDEDGYYWIAGVDGAALYVFDPDGRLKRTIAVPFPAPTKLTFFGQARRSIAVTSKVMGENGGLLGVADLPETFTPGKSQPSWTTGQL